MPWVHTAYPGLESTWSARDAFACVEMASQVGHVAAPTLELNNRLAIDLHVMDSPLPTLYIEPYAILVG